MKQMIIMNNKGLKGSLMNFKTRDQSKDTIVQRRDDEQLEEMALARLRK